MILRKANTGCVHEGISREKEPKWKILLFTTIICLKIGNYFYFYNRKLYSFV